MQEKTDLIFSHETDPGSYIAQKVYIADILPLIEVGFKVTSNESLLGIFTSDSVGFHCKTVGAGCLA